MCEAFAVFGPVARQEDEGEELHAPAEDGHVFEGFFEDDEDVAVHARGVGYPPEVEPVGV